MVSATSFLSITQTKPLFYPRNIAVLHLQDNGNTCLHLCVKYGLKNMYSHVIEKARNIIKRDLLNYKKELLKKKGVENDNKNLSGLMEDDDEYQNLVRSHNKKGFHLEPSEIKLNPSDKNESQLQFWLENWTERKINERLVRVLNEDLHSPLTLAACMMKNGMSSEELDRATKMFQFLVEQQCSKFWEYGKYCIDYFHSLYHTVCIHILM